MKGTLENPARLLTKEQSQRISVLKVWLTIMVIFIHNFSSGSVLFEVPAWLATLKFSLSQVISRVAVPSFFFLSAFFLYSKPFSWKENLKSKCRSLLAPYLILNTFWVITFATAQHIAFLAPFFSNSSNIIIANWTVVDWLHAYLGFPSDNFPADYYPMLYPLWFIRDLLALNLLSAAYSKFVLKFSKLSLTAFILMWIFVKETHVFFLNIQSVCFWGMGCWFAEGKHSFAEFDKINKPLLSVSYAILVVVRCALRPYDGIFLLAFHRICVLVGTVFWYVFATQLKGKPRERLLFIARYTFCIYLFHEFMLTVFRKVATRLFPPTVLFQVVLYCFLPFVILEICLAWSVTLEKFFPKVYAILSGGRH